MFALNNVNRKTDKKPIFNGYALVCDNNPMNLLLICDHLKIAGLNVIITVDGDDCIEIVKTLAQRLINNSDTSSENDAVKHFDLIFIDIQISGINGLEISNKIKRIDEEVPIIALTNDNFIENRMTYYKYGIVDCLGKPIRKQDLWYCLEKYITPKYVM